MKKLFILLLCAVSFITNAQWQKGMAVRLPEYKGNGVYESVPKHIIQEDNEIAYSKYDETFDRTNYYNKSDKLLFYKIWNELHQRYEVRDGKTRELLKYIEYNEISKKWEVKEP